jgi:hypothetical protein
MGRLSRQQEEELHEVVTRELGTPPDDPTFPEFVRHKSITAQFNGNRRIEVGCTITRLTSCGHHTGRVDWWVYIRK